MNTRIFGLAVIASVALACGVGQASAATCSGEYNAANGTTTLPGTNIGTLAAGCEIGPFSATFGANGNAATVNTTANPSIYQFTWGGGNLTIEEMIGNNGIGYNIDVELGLLSTVTLNTTGPSAGSLSGTGVVSSTSIAYQSGPTTSPTYVTNDVNLAAGTYVLDTFLGTCAVELCSGSGSSTDPQYQVLFTDPPAPTPLPAAWPLFASGLGALGLFGWRRKRKNPPIAAA